MTKIEIKTVPFGTVSLRLYDDLAYKWTIRENCCVRGYAYVDDRFLCGHDLLNYVSSASVADAQEKMRRLNGFYNVILNTGTEVLACVDPVRSMPLFYTEGLVCDGLRENELQTADLNADALAVFRRSLFVPHAGTLVNGYYQICAGGCLIADGEKMRQMPLFTQHYGAEQITDLQEAVSLLDEAYLKSFARVIQILDGRTAVLPLSGGHDSRLIAWYLKKLGYDQIIAYSYGLPGNQEAVISKKVAEELRIPWHFVEYDPAGMRKLMRNDYRKFALMAGNCTSVPCLQEWYAIYVLRQRGILDENCVIIPGYSGDQLAGTHLLKNVQQMVPITADKLKEKIRDAHFCERGSEPSTDASLLYPLLDRECPELVDGKTVFSEDEANLLFERFDTENRQAKFIENAVRVYDYWGYQWLTPFFEKTQFEGWAKVSNSLRYDRRAFFALEDAVYSDGLKAIPFAGSGTAGRAVPGWRRKLNLLLCGPSMLHPMYGYYRLGLSYYRDLYKRRLRGVNAYAQDLYLGYLMEIQDKRQRGIL